MFGDTDPLDPYLQVPYSMRAPGQYTSPLSAGKSCSTNPCPSMDTHTMPSPQSQWFTTSADMITVCCLAKASSTALALGVLWNANISNKKPFRHQAKKGASPAARLQKTPYTRIQKSLYLSVARSIVCQKLTLHMQTLLTEPSLASGRPTKLESGTNVNRPALLYTCPQAHAPTVWSWFNYQLLLRHLHTLQPVRLVVSLIPNTTLLGGNHKRENAGVTDSAINILFIVHGYDLYSAIHPSMDHRQRQRPCLISTDPPALVAIIYAGAVVSGLPVFRFWNHL